MSITLAAARPQATVYQLNGKPTKRTLPVPDVMLGPIRQDIVNFVHTNMAKNRRQPYGVKCQMGPKGIVAGMQVNAQSWGTGRAVARIPRVKGGGTHRAGQGAFGNQCRGGRMFAPTKTYRRWHRKININQKRYAVCSAIAASAVPALVMARGHRIQKVDEIPLIIENDFEKLHKTKAAQKALHALRLGQDLRRCKRRYKRAGRGKARNRRFRHRQGPLIVYCHDKGIWKAARNIRGVEFCSVHHLNLLKLCPGGHMGRMVIWTERAFRLLSKIYGTQLKQSRTKHNYQMPRPLMTNSDLSRIIKSQEIQSVLRPTRRIAKVLPKRNPLKHPELYAKLNPLFERVFKEQKEKKLYPANAKPKTTKILKPMKKAKRVRRTLNENEKKDVQKYWNLVMGTGKIFKTRKQLQIERKAVIDAAERAEREKAGLDIMGSNNDNQASGQEESKKPEKKDKKKDKKEETPESD